jgi:hypothetical protein
VTIQYEFNIFNLFNTTSMDVPQNQTQIRQASACSNSAIENALPPANGGYGYNCQPGQYYYVNYGQIVTGPNTADQQSALTNLDQKPIFNGSGRTTTIPTTLNPGQGACTTYNVDLSGTCPNNGANFGSVTGTIGGNRAITMALHVTF